MYYNITTNWTLELHIITIVFYNCCLFLEGAIQEPDGSLLIENLVPQEGGNYSCHVGSSNKIVHELVVITMPIFTVSTKVVYNITQKCEEEDSDILSLYLPSVLNELLCGKKTKICSVDVTKTYCFEQVSIFSIFFFSFLFGISEF